MRVKLLSDNKTKPALFLLMAALTVAIPLACSSDPRPDQAWTEFRSLREFELADDLKREGKTDESRLRYHRIRRDNPFNLAAFLAEIQLATTDSIRQGLRDDLEALIRVTPEAVGRARFTALLALLQEDPKEGESLVDGAIALDIRCGLAQAIKAQFLDKRAQDVEAKKHWENAVQGDLPPPFAFRNMAAIALKEDDKKGALRYLESYVAMRPRDAKALFNLGTLELDMDRISPAYRHLELAYDLDPDSLDLMINFSHACIKNGKIKNAEAVLERARRLHPNVADIYFNLALLYADHHDNPAAAIENFRLYLEKGGEDKMRVATWIEGLQKRVAEQ